MKRLLLFLIFGASAFAQMAAVTNPGSGTPTLNADAGQINYALASTCSACGNIAAAAYYLDGSASIPGSGELLGVSRTPPYSFNWNAYYAGNGLHTVYVDYLGLTNTVLATSPAVRFKVENNLPQNTCSTTCTDITVVPELVAEINLGSALGYLTNAVSFYSARGTPAIVGGAPCGRSTSGTVDCGATAAGHTLAMYTRWQSSSATLTCTTNNGGTVAYGTIAKGGPIGTSAGQWVYAYDIRGGRGTTLTCRNSASASFLGSIGFEISGTVTTNPLDVNVAGTGGGSITITPGFALGHSAKNEIILAGSTWGGLVTATHGPGWTNIWNENNSLAVEAIQPSGAIFGSEQFAVTVNGPNSGINKTFKAFVDGLEAASSETIAATKDIIVNTAQFLNAPHQMLIRVDGGNCPGCRNGVWSDMGGWEQTQTFTNAVVPSQLLLSAREVMLTAGGPSVTMTATDLNANGSTTTARLTRCVPNSTTHFTITGVCTVKPTSATGIDFVTATDSNGLTRVFWPFVLNPGERAIPNFGADGQIHSGYVSNSIWRASSFVSCDPFMPLLVGVTSAVNLAASWGPGLAQAGFNTIECGTEVPRGPVQRSFESAVAREISVIGANLSTYGQGKLKWVYLNSSSWFQTTDTMYETMLGPASPGGSAGWTINPFKYVVQQWVNSGMVQQMMAVDEVGGSWGGNPLEGTDTGGIIIGTNGFTALSGDGTTCTVAWPAPNNDRFTGARSFIITGSGTALDYSSSTNGPRFVYSSRTSTGITFPCSYSGRLTSGATQLHTYVYTTFDRSGKACPPGGSSSGPCTRYLPYNMFSTIRSWLTSVPNFTPIAWPLQGSCCTYGISNWSGATSVGGVKVGDYWEQYVSTVGTPYLPSGTAMSPLISQIGDLSRNSLNYMDRATPLIGETAGTVMNYSIGPYPSGYQIAVTSCSGNTITTATPHLIYHVTPEQTKLTVHGSGNAACDGNYYVIAAPTATKLSVVLANSTFSGSATGGTITFANGNTYTLATIFASNSRNTPGSFNSTVNNTCPNNWKNNRGQMFTVSGSSSSNVNAMTGWFDNGYTLNVCEAPGAGGASWWRQVPNLSSTGGTAYIIPDGAYRRGINWVLNSYTSPRVMFASINELAIEGGSGHRAYQIAYDPDYSDLTMVGVNSAMSATVEGKGLVFGGTDLLDEANLSGINPVTDFGRSQEAAMAHTNPNLIHERILKYEYQTRLNSPDYGQQFEAAARTGVYGNLLMIQSFVDASITCTANLAPYLISGQPIIRFSMTWDSIQPVDVIAAGTTTDSKMCAPGEFRAYLFPNNAAAELKQPPISARLADVPNATDIVIQYSYSPLAFTSPSVAGQMLYQTFDCGTGTCTPPWDRNIGPIYYRLVYLDSSGRILTPPGLIHTL